VEHHVTYKTGSTDTIRPVYIWH